MGFRRENNFWLVFLSINWKMAIVYLFCISGTVNTRLWLYWTNSEKSSAKLLNETSPLPRLNGLSKILVRDLVSDMISVFSYIFYHRKLIKSIAKLYRIHWNGRNNTKMSILCFSTMLLLIAICSFNFENILSINK